jgi:hypothetical protein
MASIFISHAVADKPLVDNLYNLLQTGCDIRSDDLICTSIDGAGIKTGEDFIGWIKEKLKNADFFILVVTPNYFASKFCMAEMGAAWALEKKVFPLVIPNIPREIGVVMLGKQTAEMSNAGLDELRDEIAKIFPEAGRSTPRWNVQKQGFIGEMPKMLAELPAPNLVERIAFNDEQEKVTASLELIHELKMQIAGLNEQIAVLETLKDKDAVQEIKIKSLPPEDQYTALLEQIGEELSGYSAVEIRCLYALFTEDWWYPSDDFWRERGNEIERAIKSNWIHQRSGENCFRTNRSHPRYTTAIAAIENLWDYIGDMDKRLKKVIEEREKYEIDIQNLEYWSKAIWKPYLLSMD